MIEIRIHGRGGQGVVTAAELIAVAAFYDEKFSQAFPSFGVERRGAPVEAYTRIGDKFINRRWHIYEPDFIIVQDATLLGAINVFKGAEENTLVIINTEKNLKELKGLSKGLHIKTVPATQIALDILGRPIINTILLGAFAGMTKLLKPSSLEKAIRERFKGEIGEKNIKAMKTAYCHTNPDDKYCYLTKKAKIPLDSKQKFAVTT